MDSEVLKKINEVAASFEGGPVSASSSRCRKGRGSGWVQRVRRATRRGQLRPESPLMGCRAGSHTGGHVTSSRRDT